MIRQFTPLGTAFELIHFLFRVNDNPPEYRIACMPNMTEFHKTDHHPAHQRSDSTAAVTCPSCKRTEVYRRSK